MEPNQNPNPVPQPNQEPVPQLPTQPAVPPTPPSPPAGPAPQPPTPPTPPTPPIPPAPPVSPAQPAAEYNSNPFTVMFKGAARVFNFNGVPSLLLFLWMMVAFLVGGGLFVMALVLGPIGALVGLLVFVALAYMITWMYGANITLALAAEEGNSLRTGEALGQARRFAPHLFGLSVVTSLIVLIGFVFLIIPGFLFLGWFALAPVAMVKENLGVMKSLRRSRELASGHVLEILGALFAVSTVSVQSLLGVVMPVATMTERYSQISALKISGAPKPKTHWMNGLLSLQLLNARRRYQNLYLNLPPYCQWPPRQMNALA